ncbi:WD40 repeat-like protein [Trametes cingulata]|nr:WD40 repeat-like protein [Trametes cingulata]
MNAQATVLPICTVQHDFQAVVKEVLDGIVPEDTFWVSCYKYGEPSVHGKAVAALDEHNRDLVLYQGRDGIQFRDNGAALYSVACPSLHIGDTRIVVPSTAYSIPSDVRKQTHITAFDVAPDGSQFATGYFDGSVYIRPATSSSAPPSATSKPHLSTVTCLRFFPSSRVILTAGADFSLSILPADPPESSSYTTTKVNPARTLRGHTRAVTSTAIIARGRNVLSASKDGTIRLWDVPSSSQIRTLAAGSNHFVPVTALSSGERRKDFAGDAASQDAPDDLDPREVETSDKVVFCALQDGSFELFDLRTKRATFRSQVTAPSARSALQTIAYNWERNLVATGSASGLVSVYDVRTLGEGPTVTFRRNEAPIEELAFVELTGDRSGFAQIPSNSDAGVPIEVGVAIATEDGLPYIAQLGSSGPTVRAELVGTDCDAVRFVKVVGQDVWTAADDGVVRRYKA